MSRTVLHHTLSALAAIAFVSAVASSPASAQSTPLVPTDVTATNITNPEVGASAKKRGVPKGLATKKQGKTPKGLATQKPNSQAEPTHAFITGCIGCARASQFPSKGLATKKGPKVRDLSDERFIPTDGIDQRR